MPIKKVRIKENIGGAEKLKEDINKYVNPRNNHHVLIYKDSSNNLKENVVTFWTTIERKRTGEAIYKLPLDGKEIVTTLHINDMFLLGLNEDEIDWENPNYQNLKENLYRVQKTSKKEKAFEFYFRHNLASTLNYSTQGVSIQSFKKWNEYNPIKVKLNCIGLIEKL